MRLALSLAAVLTAVSCRDGSGDSASTPPAPTTSQRRPEEAYRIFLESMESNDVHLKGLQEETARRAGVEAYRTRIGRLRRNAATAAGERIKKKDEAHQALGEEFKAYLALLDDLAKDSWDDPVANFQRVERRCSDCHTKFQEE